MKKVPLSKLKALAEAKGIKFSSAEYTLLCMINVAELPEATPGSKADTWYFQCDGFRILLKRGADIDNLAGKIEICEVVIKEVEYKFLVVS